MQTRRKFYQTPNTTPEGKNATRKRRRLSAATSTGRWEKEGSFFDGLPIDIELLILCKLSRSATCPADLIGVIITCKKWKELVFDPAVLFNASPEALAVKASRWSASAHKFLKLCVGAGNLQASYLLGMIHFYCLQDRRGGVALLTRAAAAIPEAIYSLAVIKFNGSGGSKKDRDLRAGAIICARAAATGHIQALRELGHCLQDGYGVRADPVVGRHCILKANAREIAALVASSLGDRPIRPISRGLATSWGWDAATEGVRAFLAGWRHGRGRVKCGGGCGRVETRRHEFRRCSMCGKAKYCSRACQAEDWRGKHMLICGNGRRGR